MKVKIFNILLLFMFLIGLSTYAEVKFIEAEAAFRDNNKSRALSAYRAGIRANMQKFQVASTDIDTYMNDVNRVVNDETLLTLADIFKQKYIANYLNPETWNDVRRNGYAGYTMPSLANLPTFIRRLNYTQGERNKNSANVPVDLDRTVKLWWDQ